MDFNISEERKDFNILDYTEPIFRFCLNRLNSRHEAEDLSQEILLHILDGFSKREIRNPEAYVWKIAHNRYARKIDGRNKLNKREFFCGDMILNSIAENVSVEDELIKREEHAAVFSAVHSLSASYRDILVDFYVGELYIHEIAKKYNLTKETVKWRLYTAKEKIKERVNKMSKTYKKINWHVMCNGSFDPDQYLKTQVYKAIAAACYEKPLEIEEISLKTGIPTLYLEEALEYMVYGDAIEQTGGKYATDFIILYAEDNKKMQTKVLETVKDLPKKVWDTIEQNLPEIKKLFIYGADFPIEKLGHLLLPISMREILFRLSKNYESVDFPQRKDGGSGWFIVREHSEDLENFECGCNNYYSEKDGVEFNKHYYWFGKTFNSNLNNFFKKHDFLVEYFDENGVYITKDNAELTAELLKYNIMQKQSAGHKSNIPFITYKNLQKIHGIFGDLTDSYADDLSGFVKVIHQEYERFVPERLKEQIKGNIGGYTNEIIPLIQNELLKQGLLRDFSNDEVFTDNIIFTR